MVRPFMMTGYPWDDWQHPRGKMTTVDAWWELVQETIERGFREGGTLNEAEVSRLTPLFRNEFFRLDKWGLYPDSIPTLERLSSLGWKHFLLTNHVPELDRFLDRLQISPYFEAIYNSAITGFEKPHPDAFRQITQRLPEGSKVWMIGDNLEADVRGAESVGIKAVLVRKAESKARWWLPDLSGLETLIEG